MRIKLGAIGPYKKKRSPRQEKMLKFISRFMAENGLPPTVRDIQKACNISSTSVVDYNLRLLQRDGFLRRRPDVARGIELLGESGKTTSSLPLVPVIGYISAGQPLPGPSADGWASQEPLENLELPKHIVNSKTELYALRVKGTSMIDALIDDGDTVIMKQAHQVETGQIAAVRLKLEDETTLKRVYIEDSTIRLQPANPHMDPIHVPANNVEILSRLIAVWRFLG